MSATAVQRDLHPHKSAVAAMWFFHDRYAKQGMGSMGFWDSLPESAKRLCRDMVAKIGNAPDE